MKTKHLLLIIFTGFISCFSISAQQKTTITGKITDASSKDYLPGAAIILQDTKLATITDPEGVYSLYGVAPGTYTLSVSYIGYEEYTPSVTIREGEDLRHNIKMQPTFIQLHGVDVIGQRQGQMKALNQQKEADNQKNIVAYEQMESFPDLNTAEVLQRLPGVNISRDMGEGKFVFIRGTDPRLTQVKINGEMIATPEDAERFVALNVISTSQISSIEVTKSITPDMDGDAIGGVIDLKTRSAFDSDKPLLRVTAGSGYDNMVKKPNYRGDITFASKIGEEKKFGISFNANYQLTNRGAHGIEPRWTIDQPNINGEIMPIVFSDLEMKHFVASRERWGFGGQFEFRPNEDNKFTIGGMYNKRNDQQTRNIFRIRANQGIYINPGLVYNARSYLQLFDRLESQALYAISEGGENKMKTLTVKYHVAYSYGKQEKKGEGQIQPEFQRDQRYYLGIDTTDYRIPKFSFIERIMGDGTFIYLDEDTIHDAELYALDQVDWRIQNTSNKDLVGSIDFSLPYKLVSFPGSIQFGGKARIRNKDRDNERYRYRHTDEVILMSPYVKDYVDDFLVGNYTFGPILDVPKMRNFFEQYKDSLNYLRPEYRWIESLGETYFAEEKVYSGYAMFRQNFGNLLILGGLRAELTTTRYDGKDLKLDANGGYISHTDTTNSRSYLNLFPNMQMRYRIAANTNLRFAMTKGISRPNYYDLVPYS